MIIAKRQLKCTPLRCSIPKEVSGYVHSIIYGVMAATVASSRKFPVQIVKSMITIKIIIYENLTHNFNDSIRQHIYVEHLYQTFYLVNGERDLFISIPGQENVAGKHGVRK